MGAAGGQFIQSRLAPSVGRQVGVAATAAHCRKRKSKLPYRNADEPIIRYEDARSPNRRSRLCLRLPHRADDPPTIRQALRLNHYPDYFVQYT